MSDAATVKLASYLQKAYDALNTQLWGGTLPDALITLQRHRGANGYFAPERFAKRGSEAGQIDEIALNPDTFANRDDKDIVSTLAHEMCHLWQQHFDKPSRGGYHNKRWANEMLRIGLTPVSYDQPGKMTGQRVGHKIDEGGLYDITWSQLELDGTALLNDIWPTRKAASRTSANKIKYTCPLCDLAAWGKPHMNIICGECDERME